MAPKIMFAGVRFPEGVLAFFQLFRQWKVPSPARRPAPVFPSLFLSPPAFLPPLAGHCKNSAGTTNPGRCSDATDFRNALCHSKMTGFRMGDEFAKNTTGPKIKHSAELWSWINNWFWIWQKVVSFWWKAHTLMNRFLKLSLLVKCAIMTNKNLIWANVKPPTMLRYKQNPTKMCITFFYFYHSLSYCPACIFHLFADLSLNYRPEGYLKHELAVSLLSFFNVAEM